MKTAISYFEDDNEVTKLVDGKVQTVIESKILCVFNRGHGAWMLPGSDSRNGVRPGETDETAQARVLYEETGLRTTEAKKIYDQSNGCIFAVGINGTARDVGFLSRQEFLKASPFRPFFENKLFPHLDAQLEKDARVVSSGKSGKKLYSAILESWRKNHDGVLDWCIDPAEFLHAFTIEDAIFEVESWKEKRRILIVNGVKQVSLAIGFRVESEQGDGKNRILVA